MAKEYGKRIRLSPEEEIMIYNLRNEGTISPIKDNLSEKIRRALLNKSLSVEELADRFNVSPKEIRLRISKLKDDKFSIETYDNNVSINTSPLQGGKTHLNDDMWKGDYIRFGFTSDNHLCSYWERLDVLNLLYDIFEGENISVVLNGGNWIDGEARFNKNEIHTKGMTKQIEYAVNTYPFKKGIETWFISGDDHEGWYNQREGINIGEYFQLKREQSGKFDMKHLGYVEADISLNEGKFENESYIRVMHPGGGSAYALSYAPQKIVESLQGGEKPAVLFIGHYHKMLYAQVRNVHTIQMGATQDQTKFLRKMKIESQVGGGIVTLRRSADGIINRCMVEYITAFDRKFYLGKDKYWK